jgi:hypothetical protein
MVRDSDMTTKPMWNSGLKQLLLDAPDSQMDASMKSFIQKWPDPPTSLHVLEVLDRIIFAALASGFVVRLMQVLYDDACKREGTTHESNVSLAIWRENP